MSTNSPPLPPSGSGDPGGTSPGHCDPNPDPKDEKGDSAANRCCLPRPPVPGEEIGAQWDPRAPEMSGMPRCGALMQHESFFHDEGGGDGPAVVGSAEAGSPCSAGEGSNTPPLLLWSKSLEHLLEDASGVKLFTKFLKEEVGSMDELHFLFACKGLRNFNPDVDRLVPSIFKRFLQKDTAGTKDSDGGPSRVTSPIKNLPPVHAKVKLLPETYEEIKRRVEAREFSSDIFETAQKEVEDRIAMTTYPSFLKSDLYLCCSNQQGSDSSPGSDPSIGRAGSGFLETVPEDLEMPMHHSMRCSSSDPDMFIHQQLKLTQGALAATVKQRMVAEPRQPEANAGCYLRGGASHGIGLSPYHATYHSGHLVSRQDSLRSLSSGALTDDTMSRSNGSTDGLSFTFDKPVSKRHLRRQHHRMMENAKLNDEQAALDGRSALCSMRPIPRTSTINRSKLEAPNPDEFAAALISKLEQYQRSQEQHEKITSSFKKIQESEDSAEYRRQLAMDSLPPQLLLDKLAQKFPPKEEADPSQTILDDHVSRVWQDSNQTSPAQTPGSPKADGSQQKGKTLPHLLPYVPTNSSTGFMPALTTAPQYLNKDTMMVRGAYPSMHPSVAYLAQGSHHRGGMSAAAAHQLRGSRQPPGAAASGAYPLHPYQAKSLHHSRRKDKGPDATSTFSSDSGNVPDYYEMSDMRVPPTHPIYLPKSRSMPEYMENYAAINSDGGSSGRRQGSSSRRSGSRRAPADLTDSGVSVVSDSGQSLVPSASSNERVETWLLHTTKYATGTTSVTCSVSPHVIYLEEKEAMQRSKHSRSQHTAAGAISPGAVRRSGSRRGGSGTLPPGPGVGRSVSLERSSNSPGIPPQQHHHHHHHPCESPALGGQPVQYLPPHGVGDERRKYRCSGRSMHGDNGSGSNGSTLKKQHRTPKQSGSGLSNSDSTGGGGGSSSGNSNSGSCRGASATPTASGAAALSTATSSTGSTSGTHPPECTNVVYNYLDGDVPFSIRIPSRSVTLKKFKQHLPKKGNYRFFFKKHCEEFGVIQEEITDDPEVLPIYEGRIFAQICKAD